MKSILTLTLLMIAAGAVIGAANWYTKEPIERNRKLEELHRLDGLVDETDPLKLCERGIHLLEVESQGYGGSMLVAIAVHRGELLGARVIRHSETPGFSDVLEPDNWMGRFGAEPLDGIDAVTRATITSNAVLNAIQSAMSSPNWELGDC
ncbi:MAG: FMN-binding protein [Gammaproteobacteria bacterium]|nr:FMN-binding protein [Gammaproteobacteria bacterium]